MKSAAKIFCPGGLLIDFIYKDIDLDLVNGENFIKRAGGAPANAAAISKLVKNSKPAPDVFLAASDALHISPEYFVGIEDAEAGITAIKAAGMFVVGVGTQSKMHYADLVVNSTKELEFEKIKDEFLKSNK